MNKTTAISAVTALALAAALSPGPWRQAASAGPYDAGAPAKFETVPSNESGQIGEIVSLTEQLLKKRYGDGLARRGVHPKDHGCVMADFTVNPDIPEKYRVGFLSKPGQSYKAWVRFSNATGIVTPDVTGKGAVSRGMAIKLMGVEGAALLDEPGGRTQDFLLINQPMFAFPDVSEYLEATKIQLANNEDILPYFKPPLSEKRKTTLHILINIIQPTQLANPLDATYFSASPFLFGPDRAAKFSAKPREPANLSLTPQNAPLNYLREAMKRSLNLTEGKAAVFDFRVQLRPEGAGDDLEKSYPIENASAQWSEQDAPFLPVATITIGKQNFDNPLQVTECEHLVFTPWHSLAEHQPIGGVNRMRLGVYKASSQFRAQSREPTDFPKWPF